MVVDVKQVRLGQRLADGTLWIIEQIPGLVVGADQTEILRNGSWTCLHCVTYSSSPAQIKPSRGPPIYSGVVGSKIGGGQEVAIFRQTAANFHQRRSRMLKISILPLYFLGNVGFSAQNFAFLDQNFPRRTKFSDNPKIRGASQLPPYHDATYYASCPSAFILSVCFSLSVSTIAPLPFRICAYTSSSVKMCHQTFVHIFAKC